MSDAKWWMDAGSRWHEGFPPPGWWQAPDGRWHPPGSDDTTAEMTVTPPAGGVHRGAGGRWASVWQAYLGWPQWARLAAPIATFAVTLGVLGVAASGGLLADDPATTATDETSPATTVASAGGGAAQSTAAPTDARTTTISGPSTTTRAQHDPVSTTAAAAPASAPPTSTAPTNNDIHPGARCSPEGATSLSSDGIPLTCTTQKCHGAPFSEPRWRRTAC